MKYLSNYLEWDGVISMGVPGIKYPFDRTHIFESDGRDKINLQKKNIFGCTMYDVRCTIVFTDFNFFELLCCNTHSIFFCLFQFFEYYSKCRDAEAAVPPSNNHSHDTTGYSGYNEFAFHEYAVRSGKTDHNF